MQRSVSSGGGLPQIINRIEYTPTSINPIFLASDPGVTTPFSIGTFEIDNLRSSGASASGELIFEVPGAQNPSGTGMQDISITVPFQFGNANNASQSSQFFLAPGNTTASEPIVSASFLDGGVLREFEVLGFSNFAGGSSVLANVSGGVAPNSFGERPRNFNLAGEFYQNAVATGVVGGTIPPTTTFDLMARITTSSNPDPEPEDPTTTVFFAFGIDAPLGPKPAPTYPTGLVQGPCGTSLFSDASMAAAVGLDEGAITNATRTIFEDAGLNRIEFTTNRPTQEEYITIYFSSEPPFPNTGGFVLNSSGVVNKSGAAYIFPEPIAVAYNAAGSTDPTRDMAEVVAHEVGHLLGLPHVMSDSGEFIMDSVASASPASFASTPVRTIESEGCSAPRISDRTHNPLHSLLQTVEGLTAQEASEQAGAPGTWSPVSGDETAIKFNTTSSGTTVLYDVSVLSQIDGFGGPNGLIETLFIEELRLDKASPFFFDLEGGQTVEIIASTAPGMPANVVFSMENSPHSRAGRSFNKLDSGRFSVFRVESNGIYQALSTGNVNGLTVPEPTAVVIALPLLAILVGQRRRNGRG